MLYKKSAYLVTLWCIVQKIFIPDSSIKFCPLLAQGPYFVPEIVEKAPVDVHLLVNRNLAGYTIKEFFVFTLVLSNIFRRQ